MTRTSVDLGTGDLERLLCGRAAGSSAAPAGLILHGSTPGGRLRAAVGELEEQARSGGCPVIRGTFRQGLLRPYGGLLEAVEALIAEIGAEEPALLRRYAQMLSAISPRWRGDAQLLEGKDRDGMTYTSGLADFVLRGNRKTLHEFFQKRNLAPQIAGLLIQLVLAAARHLASRRASATLLLLLEGVERSDQLTRSTLALLARYARAEGTPLLVCLAVGHREADVTRSLATDPVDFEEEWRVVAVAENADEPASPSPSRMQPLAPNERRFLTLVSVFPGAFSLSELEDLLCARPLDASEAARESLVHHGLLHRSGSRLIWSCEEQRTSFLDSMPADERETLHALVLDRVKFLDPFLAAYHAVGCADRAAAHQLALTGMEHAWGASAYESALGLAQLAIEHDDQRQIDRNLLLAMLNYEAERYREADAHLRACLEDDRPHTADRCQLEYFLGYNAVFGLADFDGGYRILEKVLGQYEAEGREREAKYVRNSIAFALYRGGQVEKAIDTEQETIELLGGGDDQDSFLRSILSLNLGRLYRTLGASTRALELFRDGMFSPNAELSPYAQLLFQNCLGHLHTLRGEHAAALATYHHAFDLSRTLLLDGLRDQVLQSLPNRIRRLGSQRVTRGDEALYYLHSNLAVACRRLGAGERVDAYLRWIRASSLLYGSDAVAAFEAAVAEVDPAGPGESSWTPEGFDAAAAEEASRHSDLLRPSAAGDGVISACAEVLLSGQPLAWVRPREVSAGVSVLDSLILLRPTDAAVAERVNLDAGLIAGSLARASFVLPQGLALFESGLEAEPLILQMGTLSPEARARLPGLRAVRSSVQVLDPRHDGALYRLLEAVDQRGGGALMAVRAFQLRGKGLAVDPAKAVAGFLASALDHLVLGDQLMHKTLGPQAAENLLALYPRLSRHAHLLSAASKEDGTFLVRMVPTWGGGHAAADYIRLRNEVKPLLDRCDGHHSVLGIAGEISPGREVTAHQAGRVGAFFRQLWNCGIVHFDHRGEMPQGQGD